MRLYAVPHPESTSGCLPSVCRLLQLSVALTDALGCPSLAKILIGPTETRLVEFRNQTLNARKQPSQ